jgi:hypothetical protein
MIKWYSNNNTMYRAHMNESGNEVMITNIIISITSTYHDLPVLHS